MPRTRQDKFKMLTIGACSLRTLCTVAIHVYASSLEVSYNCPVMFQAITIMWLFRFSPDKSRNMTKRSLATQTVSFKGERNFP